MTATDYTFRFDSTQNIRTIYMTLLDVRSWWTGIFDETILGSSNAITDEFTFTAGGGMHYSKQRLVELNEHEKICWRVIDSKLSFLKSPEEWNDTHIYFEIESIGPNHRITFTHQGLQPTIECYQTCSNAWGQYMAKLAAKLK